MDAAAKAQHDCCTNHKAVQRSNLVLPAPEEIYLIVPAEDADCWKGNEVTKDSQGIWRAGMQTLPILPKQYLIPIAEMHHHPGHFGTAALAQTVLKNWFAPGIYATAK